MTLGIKVGPQPDSIDDLITTNASFAEVWYRPDRHNDYTKLFLWCKSHSVRLGLHHWATTPDGYWQSFAFEDEAICKESEQSIRTTIDHAADIGAVYVNIHSGSRARVLYDFQTNKALIKQTPMPTDQAYPAIARALTRLDTYAKQHKILLTVETAPARIHHPDDVIGKTLDPVDISEVSISDFSDLVPNIAIANDFGHTAAECISNNRSDVYDHLVSVTTKLADRTRLLHVGFTIDPYDGSDYHTHLNHRDFNTSSRTVPNKKELIELLKKFIHRDDIFALVEPPKNHPENYTILKALVQEALG